MADETQWIVVIDDRLWRSVAKDIITYAVVVAIIGTGWLLDSTALQWIGAFMMFIALCGRFASIKKTRMRAQEAADYLRSEFGVTANAPSD